MKVVNNIIFNSLALRQSINLPGIGALRIEHFDAKLRNGRLERPVTRIVYSKNETQGAPSVIELIERQSGADREKADELYAKWLEEASKEKTVTMEGVGRIKNDFFTPSAELAALVNPDNGGTIKITKRSKTGVIAAVICSLAVVCGTGYYLIVEEDIFSTAVTYSSIPSKTEIPAQPMLVVGADSLSGQTSGNRDSTAVASEPAAKNSEATTSAAAKATEATGLPTATKTEQQTATDLASTAPATKATTKPDASVAVSKPERGKYYVIAGVYSVVQNAEKFIAKSRAKGDNALSFKVMQLSTNKFLVSIFETTSEEEANRHRNQLKNIDLNLWVYGVE